MLISMALLGLSSLLSANATPPDFQGTIRSLLSCAYDSTVTLDGRRYGFKWANPSDRNSYFVASCTPLEAELNRIVFFSSDSVSTFAFKEPKPYKGGLEQSLYRLQLDQQTFYMREDITGGMDALFDRNGRPLDPNLGSIDVSSKNVVLSYFMQQMLGKANASGSIPVGRLQKEDEAFAQDCLVKNIRSLGKALLNDFTASAAHGATQIDLAKKQNQLIQLFGQESCSADPALRSTLDQILQVVDLLAKGRIQIETKREGLRFTTRYSASSQADLDEYRRLTDALAN